MSSPSTHSGAENTESRQEFTVGVASPHLPTSENKRFYPALDGLRGLAVLLVFFQHYLGRTFPRLSWGWAGVDVFFVLSGFLITGILYDTQNATNRFRVFYMRRTLRIFPLFYGVLLLALITTPVMDWMWNPAWIMWACYLGNYARFTYLQSPLLPLGAIEHLVSRYHGGIDLTFYVGHFWSLCVEEQFYLIWPLVVFTVRRRETLRTICLCALPLALLARIACLWLLPPRWLAEEFLYRVTPLRVDALLLGGLLALCLRGSEAGFVLRASKPVLYLFSLGFVGFQAVYGTVSGTHHVYTPAGGDPVLTTVGYTLIDLFSAALILCCVSLDTPLARAFTLRPLQALGRISYGFYIFHDLLRAVYVRAVGAFIGGRVPLPEFECIVAVVGLIATTFLASLSFRYVELPFLSLKSRFKPRQSSPSGPTSVASARRQSESTPRRRWHSHPDP